MWDFNNLTLRQIIILAYAGYLILLSIIAFFAYLIDKKKAERGAWRIKEATLLLMSFLGGAFGGYTSMLIFRHKTTGEHWYFTFINILGILIHAGAMVYLVFFASF